MKIKVPKKKCHAKVLADNARVVDVEIPPLKRMDGRNEFVARIHKKDLPSALGEWKANIDWNEPYACVNIRGLTMPQQYSVARWIKKYLSREQIEKVTIDDGPYVSSANMIEDFIKG